MPQPNPTNSGNQRVLVLGREGISSPAGLLALYPTLVTLCALRLDLTVITLENHKQWRLARVPLARVMRDLPLHWEPIPTHSGVLQMGRDVAGSRLRDAVRAEMRTRGEFALTHAIGHLATQDAAWLWAETGTPFVADIIDAPAPTPAQRLLAHARLPQAGPWHPHASHVFLRHPGLRPWAMRVGIETRRQHLLQPMLEEELLPMPNAVAVASVRSELKLPPEARLLCIPQAERGIHDYAAIAHCLKGLLEVRPHYQVLLLSFVPDRIPHQTLVAAGVPHHHVHARLLPFQELGRHLAAADVGLWWPCKPDSGIGLLWQAAMLAFGLPIATPTESLLSIAWPTPAIHRLPASGRGSFAKFWAQTLAQPTNRNKLREHALEQFGPAFAAAPIRAVYAQLLGR